MALTPNFTSTQSIASPAQITFYDTSSGVDGTITTRTIFIRLSNGKWLTTAGESSTILGETWDYADASITLSLLSRSTVANVTVAWYNGSTQVYTKTILSEWNFYDYLFLFGLLSAQTSYPAINASTGYWPNSFVMVTNIFQSEKAVELMDDLYSAQKALDRNQLFIDNENLFF